MTDRLRGPKGELKVEAKVETRFATARIIKYGFFEAPDSLLRGDETFRVDMSLGPRHRSARGSFSEVWGPHRFEKIGDLFLLPPGISLHAMSDEKSTTTSIVCQLEQAVVTELFEKIPQLNDKQLSASLDIRDARLKSLMLHIAEETRQQGFASALMLELLSRQLAVELIRHGSAVNEEVVRGGLAAWQLRLIDERLESVSEAPGLQELASLCGISVRQLTRGFRTSRGVTVGTYVASSQVEHAKRMLARGESVAAIAQKLGFSSSANFCYSFRRSTGFSPGKYRSALLRQSH